MRVLHLACLGLVLSAATAHAEAPDRTKWVPVQIAWDKKIPMRDGVKLSATVYRQLDQNKPLPVILTPSSISRSSPSPDITTGTRRAH